MWEVKERTHYLKSVGREVPGVVAVLCAAKVGVGKKAVGYKTVIVIARPSLNKVKVVKLSKH